MSRDPLTADQEHERVISQLASVHMFGRIAALRGKTDRRIDGYRDRYAPILAKLSATEWIGLMSAIEAEIPNRDDAVEHAFRETLEREHSR